MKRTNKIILATVAAATLAAGIGGIANAAGGHGHERGGSNRGAMMLEMFDTDGDGSVTIVEMQAAQAERLAEFDADGDGSLSLEEFQVLYADGTRERMVDGFQRLDADGDGIVTAEEFNAPVDRMAGMDRDGDGVLDRPERGDGEGRRGGGEMRHGQDNDDN